MMKHQPPVLYSLNKKILTLGLSEGIVIEKFPSKSVKAPRFESESDVNSQSGRLFSSLTVPEIVFVWETNIGNKINNTIVFSWLAYFWLKFIIINITL